MTGLPAQIDDELKAAGLTYRQLDYWFRTGLLRASPPRDQLGLPCNGDPNTPGNGHRRTWTADERRVALITARLKRAGLTLPVAVEVARGRHEIGPGIWVVIAA